MFLRQIKLCFEVEKSVLLDVSCKYSLHYHHHHHCYYYYYYYNSYSLLFMLMVMMRIIITDKLNIVTYV